MEDKIETVKKIAIFALVFALLSIGIAENIAPTNTTIGVKWIINNTNMAPFVAGHGGTGERVGDNTTYWNNATPIEIFLYSHANTTGTAAEIHLFINGTKVSDTSGRALGVAEQSNRSIVATIPQYSFYSVEMQNYHHYEWYEYKILTGNVTTNITTSGSGGAGCIGNCSFDKIYVNEIRKNNTSDTYLNFIKLSYGLEYKNSTTNNLSSFSLNSGNWYAMDVLNTATNNFSYVYGTTSNVILGVGVNAVDYPYIFGYKGLDMVGKNITNVNNISSNNLYVNSIHKNDTTDIYSSYINIGSAFANDSGTVEKVMDMTSPQNFIWQVTNITTGYSSRIDMYSNVLQLQVSDGTNNFIKIDTEDVSILSNTGNYTFNTTDANWNNANITNIRNLTSNYPDSNLSTGMFYRTGSYLGDGTTNKPIYHGLGRIPVFITISRKSDGGYGQIQMGMDGLMQNPFGVSTYRVTQPDFMYFYVGNSTSYINSMNPSGYNMAWVAWG